MLMARTVFRLAEAAIKQSEEVVKDVLFPVVDEETLQALVKGYYAQGPRYQRHIHTLICHSYSRHNIFLKSYRDNRYEPGNTAWQPVRINRLYPHLQFPLPP